MQTDNKNIILYLAAIVLMGFVGWYVFGGGSGNSNNVDQRLSGVESRISGVEAKQRETTVAIESAIRTVGDVRETAGHVNAGLVDAQATADRGAAESATAGESISGARKTVSECQAVIADSTRRIDACESIFDRVAASDKIGAQKAAAAKPSP